MRNKVIALILTVVMLFSFTIINPAFAAEPRVSISGNSYIELLDAQYFERSNIFSFDLRFVNNSGSELNLVDYWARVQLKNGNTINAIAINPNETQNKLAPNTSEVVSFYANVGDVDKITDLKIQVIRWALLDPSVSDYMRTVGTIQIPAAYDQPVDVGKSHVIELDDSSLAMSVDYVSSSAIGDNYQADISLTLENIGNFSTQLPAYNFYLVTDDQIYYSLNATNQSESSSIAPRSNLNFQLSGTIPMKVKIDNLKLVMTRQIRDNIEARVVAFRLPDVTESQNNLGSTYKYTNNYGTYEVTLVDLQRLPWEDEDILTAELQLANKSASTLPVPVLDANYYLDGIKVDTSQVSVIQLDSNFGIRPNSSVNVIVTSKIPYTYEFDQMKLQLIEKQDNRTRAVVEYVQSVSNFTLDRIVPGAAYNIEQLGRRAEISVHGAKSYTSSSDTNQLMYVDIEYKNKERRAVNLQNFVAYFKSSDNVYFPAELTNYQDKIQPGSSVLLSVSAVVPGDYNINDMSLIVGQGAANQRLSEGQEPADSYVKAVNYLLPETDEEVSDNLRNVKLYPFTLSLSKVKAYVVNDRSFKLDFTYKLNQDVPHNVIAEDHQLVIEIVDQHTKAERKFVLNDKSADDAFLVGEEDKLSIIFEDADYFYYRLFNEYTINIYDEYKDYRSLLASKELQWFIESE